MIECMRLRSSDDSGSRSGFKIDIVPITTGDPIPQVEYDASGNVVEKKEVTTPRPAFEPNPDSVYDIPVSIENSLPDNNMGLQITPDSVQFCQTATGAYSTTIFGCVNQAAAQSTTGR